MIKLNGHIIEQKTFPDGSSLLPKIRGSEYADEIQWYFEDNSELWTLICLKKHLNSLGDKVILYLPYVPHSRMDRVKTYGEIFTLKHFCDIINHLNFEEVMVTDPHSNVMTALLDRCYVQSIQMLIEEAINDCKPDLLFFPDEGSHKRSEATSLIPSIFGIKKREWETGEIKGLDIIGEIPNKPFNVLMVDDICSYGGTFYHSALKLKELGANNISLYVTHCENSILSGSFTDKKIPLLDTGLIDKVYTSDSIFTKEHPKIVVLK